MLHKTQNVQALFLSGDYRYAAEALAKAAEIAQVHGVRDIPGMLYFWALEALSCMN